MVRARKTSQPKKAKSARLSLKGWAEGWRATFLNERLRRYADALEASHESENTFLKALYKEYFYYCPVSVPDTDEPVLPAEPWEATKVYPAENLTAEEMVVKRDRMKVLKKRIRGYLRYRTQKLWRIRSSLRHSVLDDGFAVLLAKLSGITKPPKARQAFQQWWTTNKQSISEQAKKEHQVVCDDLKKNNVPEAEWPLWNVDFHSDYARKTFKAMPKEEQEEWGKMAKAEAAEAKEEYKKKMTSPPSNDPKDRAARIENMVSFLAPILEGVHDLTGLHVVVSAVGPMPHRGGEHAVISAASGLNLDPEPVAATHWQSDPVALPGGGLQERGHGAWRDHLLSWASTAYTPSDMIAATIPGSTPTVESAQQAGAEPHLSTIDLEREVLRRMDEDDADDADEFYDDDFDSDESDEEEGAVSVPKKRAKKQGGGVPKKRVVEKENEPPKDVEEGDEELYDHNGRRLSQYELDRNANIRRNKGLLANLMEGVELPWQKAAREKEEAAAAKKRAATEKAQKTRLERAKKPPGQPTRQSGRVATTSGAVREENSPMDAPPLSDATSQSTETMGIVREDEHDRDIEDSVPGVLTATPKAATDADVSGSKESAAPRGIVEENGGEGCGVAAATPTESTTVCAEDVRSHRTTPAEEPNVTHIPQESPPARPRPTALGPVLSGLSMEMKAAVDDSPDWFRLPYRHFNEAKLGKEWRKLIDAFVELEACGDFKASMGSVETRKRPKLLSDWTKRGRHSKKDEVLELPLTGISTFATVYAAWWDGMQLSWRTKVEGAWAREVYGEEWGLLVARGVLGWLSIVACLFWWGNAVSRARKAKERETWVEAVMDAEWMMRGVTAATS